MSGGGAPTFDWLIPKPVADNSQAPTFDWLTKTHEPEAEKQAPGFIDYVKNLASNWFKVEAVRMGMGDTPDQDKQFTDPEMITIRNALRQSQASGSGFGIAMEDLNIFGSFFGKLFENSKGQIDKIFAAPAEAAAAFKHDPVGFAGNLAKAFATPIGDFAELGSGVHLTDNDISALTPEEKAARIKGTVATAAMIATGMGVARAFKGAVIAADASTETLLAASRLTAKGALAKDLLKSTAVAGASGGVFGLTKHANEADQLSETLINGVMFAPLGVAFELLGGFKGAKAAMSNAKAAGEIAQLRQVQDVMGNSVDGVIKQASALSTANDLAEAVLGGKLGAMPENGIVMVSGFDITKSGSLARSIPENFRSTVHMREDGTADLLVYDTGGKKRIEPDKYFVSNDPVKGVHDEVYHTGDYAGGLSDPSKSITGQTGSLGKGLYFYMYKEHSNVPAVAYGVAEGVKRAFKISPKARILDLNAPLPKSVKAKLLAEMQIEEAESLREAIADGTIKTTNDLYRINQDYELEYPTLNAADLNAHIGELGYHGVKDLEQINLFHPQAGDFVTHLGAVKTAQEPVGISNLQKARDTMVKNRDAATTADEHAVADRAIKSLDKRIAQEAAAQLIDDSFFAKHGVLKDQVVSLDGSAEWKIVNVVGKELILENRRNSAQRITVAKDAIRTLPAVKFGGITSPSGIRVTPLTPEIATSKLYDDWKAGISKPPPSAIESLYDQRANMVRMRDAAPAETRLELDKQLSFIESQIRRVQAKTSNELPIGFDETPPEFIDRVPTVNIPQHLNDYLDGKQFTPDQKAALKRDFEGRLAKEAFASNLDDAERALVTDAFKAIEEHNTSEARALLDARTIDTGRLVRMANSNGMSISDGGSGRIIIRDIESGRILKGFDNNAEAAAFINKSGQASGIDLDQPNSISGSGASGGNGLPPEGPPAQSNDFPYNFFSAPRKLLKRLSSEELIRGLDNEKLITRNREFMLNVDGKYKTEIHTKVMEPTQRGANVRNTRMTPYLKAVAEIEKPLVKMHPALREKIGQYLQTMTPAEVIERFMSRPMNGLEQSLGRQVGESGVDIERVFKYSRELEKLDKEFPADARAQDRGVYDAYLKEKQVARTEYGIDDKHAAISELFDEIKGMGKKEASLGAIVRLARAIQDGELSRGAFAAKHKMTPEQLSAASKIEGMYAQLADKFGISQAQRLGGYMTHARLYTNGNISQALRHFSGDVAAREFYAKMARTGEIAAHETDPIKALQRYIKAGFDEQSGFSKSIAEAQSALSAEIKKLPIAAQKNTRNVVERYLGDMQGYPEAGDMATQESVDYFINKHKLELDLNVRKQIVNAITAIIPAATQGARPMAGITDWAMSTTISVSDRGLAYTKRVHEQGYHAKRNPEVLDEIRAAGALTNVSPIAVYSQAEYAENVINASRIQRGALKVAGGLFKLSGQADIYEFLSAGHYLATKADALGALTKFGRKEITWKQVKKITFLDKHYEPVVRQFEKLAKAGKAEEAASYLGTQTVNDMVGVFGNANHPYMWGTNPGRVIGQFGNWSMWFRSTVTRMASRGTVGQRIASIAKLSAISWATVEAGEEVGINLNRMRVFAAMSWAGGPMEDIAEDVNAAVGGSGYTRTAALRRLSRVLPYDPKTGKLQSSIFVPGSFAADGIMNGINDLQRGNALVGGAEILGFRKIPQPHF